MMDWISQDGPGLQASGCDSLGRVVATGASGGTDHRGAAAQHPPRAWATLRPIPPTRGPPMTTSATLEIPQDLRPADGRFGCGPSKVRPEQLEHLVQNAAT